MDNLNIDSNIFNKKKLVTSKKQTEKINDFFNLNDEKESTKDSIRMSKNLIEKSLSVSFFENSSNNLSLTEIKNTDFKLNKNSSKFFFNKNQFNR